LRFFRSMFVAVPFDFHFGSESAHQSFENLKSS
jgi:hypothetical protein